MIRIEAGPVEVRLYRPSDAPAWEKFALGHPAATVFHRLAWSEAVQASYGHRSVHLTAWRQGHIAGVLPLFLVESVFVGRVLVSVPYGTYGGILGDSDETVSALLEHARGIAEDVGAEYVELRHRDPNGLDLPELDRYDTFRKALPERPEEVLPALPKKTRTAVRRGLSSLGEDCVDVGPQWLDAIYDLYAFTLRRLGSPNYRRLLFHELQRTYGGDCICLVVRDGGLPVAGVVSFVFRDEIVPYFSGSLPEAMEKRANNVMYLRLMELAVERGLRVFDFNRTRRDNSGPYDFKRHHGFEPTPLHYQVVMNRLGKPLPNLSPSNGKFALAGRAWSRLPLWFTRPAGAYVSKWIP